MDLIKEIANSPAVIKEIYGDLAKPGVQQIGKALSTIVGLGNTVLWPVALLNEKAKLALEANLEKYREKLKDTPPEKICEVPPEVGVPIAEKLTYVTNAELSDMYTELLAKASKLESSSGAHPSFVNIINNLSPDEAVLLKNNRMMTQGIPYIEARLQFQDQNHWNTLNPMMPGIFGLDELAYPNNLDAYISNLEGLGVLQVRSDIYMAGENIYEPLENRARKIYHHLVEQIPRTQLDLVRGKIEVTSFGKMFISACITLQKDN